jgi:hypothetical protein
MAVKKVRPLSHFCYYCFVSWLTIQFMWVNYFYVGIIFCSFLNSCGHYLVLVPYLNSLSIG